MFLCSKAFFVEIQSEGDVSMEDHVFGHTERSSGGCDDQSRGSIYRQRSKRNRFTERQCTIGRRTNRTCSSR